MTRARIPRRLRRAFVAAGVALAIAAVLGFVLEQAGSGDSRPSNASIAQHPQEAPADRFAEEFDRAVAAFQTGDAHDALLALENARRLRPHVPAVHANIGFAMLELARAGEAKTSFETAIDLNPAGANAYFGLASAEEKLGNLDAARGAMKAYLHLAKETDGHFRRKAAAALWEWGERPSVTAPAQSPAPKADLEGFAAFGAPGARLEDLKGRIVVLNVWAMWCPPCRAELPDLQALADSLKGADVAVVGLNVDRNPALAREFLREAKIGFPNWADPGGQGISRLTPTDKLPVTLVLGRDGEVLTQALGIRAWDRLEIRDLLLAVAQTDAAADTLARMEAWLK